MNQFDGTDHDFGDWKDDLTDTQLTLQHDLSCLADGELDDATAARVMMQIEEDSDSRAFFDDIQRYARLHRDMADPDRMLARLAIMTGADVAREAEAIDLTHRLATIFYKLGKAYVLAAIQPDEFIERAFEAAVPVDAAKTSGRGFVDGVLLAGRETGARVDWREARHLLNGRLERIDDPLEKGRRLLEQAIGTDPSHEEARFYLGFLLGHEGKTLRAMEVYADLFETAVSQENRGHAAVQLGRLYHDEGDCRKALAYYRWVPVSGLLGADERFWYVRFNIAMAYLQSGDQARALDYFRRLIDSAPERIDEMIHMAIGAPALKAALEGEPGFAAAIEQRCPELFQTSTSAGDE